MTMKKYLKYLLLVALCCGATALRAQDPKDDEDPQKVIAQQKKAIEDQEEKIKDLEKQLTKLKAEKAKADSLLKAEKETGKLKEAKNQIKELQKEIDELKKKQKSYADSVSQAAGQQSKDCQAQLQQLQDRQAKDQAEITALNQQLKDLHSFRQMWLAEQVEKVETQWLSKNYPDIDMSELERTIQTYQEFVSDQRIADARNKLLALQEECRIYQNGDKLIKSPYDAAQVKAAATAVKALRDKITNANKKTTLSTLYRLLNDYGVTVEIFQDAIKAVDKQLSGQDQHRIAWPLVKATLDKQEKDYKYISAIKDIPWLKDQYEAYEAALKKDCLAPNPIHDLILNLQP